MIIQREAAAGTMESSDIMITVMPADSEIEVSLKSAVEAYYGNSIVNSIKEELEKMEIEAARIEAVDHGALDCTIRARLITAVKRACGKEGRVL